MILKNTWNKNIKEEYIHGLKPNRKEAEFSKLVHKMKPNKPKKTHEKYDEPEM